MRTKRKPLNPARVLALGFMGIILVGSLLLMLPQSYEGAALSYIDALFTATSAVCVTGLVVVDTGTFYTPFGQGIIMFLIFIGALGFMTMTTLIFIFLGRRISLQERIMIKEALNQKSIAGIIPLVKVVVRIALFFILIGTALLSIRFVPEYGLSEGFFIALFHAVSAFGNAGFDLFGNYDSLTRFPTDYLVNGTIVTLFIIGGFGFTVILELSRFIRYRTRFTLHAKLVLIISALLLSSGTVIILLLEYNNPETMGGLSGGAKLFAAFFTSATARTAGFSVLDTGLLCYSSLLILMGLMFIGASPTSTGGGVKTTTFGIVAFTLVSMIRGRHEPVIFQRRFPSQHIMKAISIISASMVLVFIATFILTLFEGQNFNDMFFEAISAFGTVGLSTGITPSLSNPSKIALIITMFCGRIGPVTLLVALAQEKPKDIAIQYPEGHLMIG
ncbi:MAG: TrkH family potassium uptake protein [Bacillota bacterium]